MFIRSKDRHKLDGTANYFVGLGCGCLISPSGWISEVGIGSIVIAALLAIASVVAHRSAKYEGGVE
jgi:hypothetical protein